MDCTDLPAEPSSRRLHAARHALDQGLINQARTLASAAFKQSLAEDDGPLQADALMALAQIDRVVGRFRRAIDTTHRAVTLFQRHGDIAGEARALALAAHSAGLLGRHEEAMESALLAMRLGELLPPQALHIELHNYQGAAYLWGRQFELAEQSIREADWLDQLHTDGRHNFQTRTNLAWLEVLRLFHARYADGHLPNTHTLSQRLTDCLDAFDRHQAIPGLPGAGAVLKRIAQSTQVLYLCWSGQVDQATAAWARIQQATPEGYYAQVADVIALWVSAELHWACQDIDSALSTTRQMIRLAQAHELEPLVSNGHLLATQIYRQQGDYAQALNEERSHRQREWQMRQDLHDSRQRVVQTHIDNRQNRRHLQQLAQHSLKLERLSYEDSLTGIANRRSFEQRVTAELEAAHPDRPLCVALLDVDDFKTINDGFSHATGDEVLKILAATLKAAVRDADLAARLGGDEFVVLFAHTDLALAQRACARLQTALAQATWPAMPGRGAVAISIGVAQAQPGDSPADLLRRADVAMYDAKAVAANVALA